MPLCKLSQNYYQTFSIRFVVSQERLRDNPVVKFRTAWEQGDFDDASQLLYDITSAVTGGYSRLLESRAAMLSLKPTKAFRQFSALCEDTETVKIILKALLKHFKEKPYYTSLFTLAYYMSMLIASGAHFPKATQTLLECGAADTLAALFHKLPSIVAHVTEPPYDHLSLMTTSNLIMTAVVLCKSQKDLARKWLQSGVLDKLLETVPFKEGCPRFSEVERLSLAVLDYVSAATDFATNLCLAARVNHGESPRLASNAAAWGAALLERVEKAFKDPGDLTRLSPEPGGVFETCVDAILRLLNLLADGFKGVFDFGPSIERVRPMLKHIPDSTWRLRILEGLARVSKGTSARSVGRAAVRGASSLRKVSVPVASQDSPFMSFSVMQKVLHMSPPDTNCALEVLTQLAAFFVKRRDDKEYRQADLHTQPSLSPLVLPLLGLLDEWWRIDPVHNAELVTTLLFVISEHAEAERSRLDDPSTSMASQLGKVGARLLSWLQVHRSGLSDKAVLMALTTVGQCASATWTSLARIMNDQRFLEVCKQFTEAQQRTVEETEDFAECILAPLQVPRGSCSTADRTAMKEALTRERMLTWVFETAAQVIGVDVQKRPNLLPLLALCSKLDLEPSSFLTPEQLQLFVRQLVGDWRVVKDVILPDFESKQRVLGAHIAEFDRLAGHVRIVEMMLRDGRKDVRGNRESGYLSNLVSGVTRASSTANFMAFCKGVGAALFVSIFEERKRLEKFQVRADREGNLRPEAADMTSRVEAVWELVAAAFALRRCANQVRPYWSSRFTLQAFDLSFHYLDTRST